MKSLPLAILLISGAYGFTHAEMLSNEGPGHYRVVTQDAANAHLSNTIDALSANNTGIQMQRLADESATASHNTVQTNLQRSPTEPLQQAPLLPPGTSVHSGHTSVVTIQSAAGSTGGASTTDQNIAINDEGYGLSDGDKTRIEQYLLGLPSELLAGLTDVIVRPPPVPNPRILINGHQIIIYADPKVKNRKASLINDVARGVGKHLFSNSPSIRAKWSAIAGAIGMTDEDGFAMGFASYTQGGSQKLFAAALGSHHPETALPAALYMASLFTAPNHRVTGYTHLGNGVVHPIEYMAKMKDGWTAFAGYSYKVDSTGKITNWMKGNVFKKYPPVPEGKPPRVIISNALRTPIHMPQDLLDYFNPPRPD